MHSAINHNQQSLSMHCWKERIVGSPTTSKREYPIASSFFRVDLLVNLCGRKSTGKSPPIRVSLSPLRRHFSNIQSAEYKNKVRCIPEDTWFSRANLPREQLNLRWHKFFKCFLVYPISYVNIGYYRLVQGSIHAFCSKTHPRPNEHMP